jgi:phosphoadenosine phosphosulfate reductase
MHLSSEDLRELQLEHLGKSPELILASFQDNYGDDLILASSLGAEDQVLTHMLLSINPKARIFVLDTGRLHQETYDVMALTMAKYGMRYEVHFPDRDDVEELLSKKGPNSFYDSVENRKECCHIRKVAPLKRALQGVHAWVTGQRRDQSMTRTALEEIEWDPAHHCIKLNPLADWTTEDVWSYIQAHDIPVNYLHKKGFPSIGCAPCTRAVKPGEDQRAGRWWWENPDSKECGLHVKGVTP